MFFKYITVIYDFGNIWFYSLYFLQYCYNSSIVFLSLTNYTMKAIKRTIKLLFIVIILTFSGYFSYLSFFLYDVVIWNTIQWTYTTYNVWKELMINTSETKDNIVWNVKKWFFNIVDKDKAEKIEKQMEEEKETETQDELERKAEQEKTRKILSLIPYFLSFITFLVIAKYMMGALVSIVTLNSEVINWLRR